MQTSTRWMIAAVLIIWPHIARAADEAPDDGLRAVNVEQYGISVRVPQAWRLITWARNDRAFVLKIPQQAGSPVGYVACEVALAPESLDAYRTRHDAADEKQQQEAKPRRKLIQNQIETLDAPTFGDQLSQGVGSRLVSVWRYTGEDDSRWYEVRVRMISHDMLYTFVLSSDEAHYQAYRIDFDRMLTRPRFSPPQSGLQRLPDGYWMQREYRFAMQLPPGWKPSFAPHENALLFASGKTHEVFTDNLLVLASPQRPLDLKRLEHDFPEQIARLDETARVESCQIVPQGERQALETVIHTERGPFRISILERRFRGARRNYEVKFTCQTDEFEKLADELRKALDSFAEFIDRPREKAL